MTLFFKNHQITIYRQRRVGLADRFVISATYTAYDVDIQPAGRERTEMAQGRYGKVYTAYVDSLVDVKEGDQIVTTSDGKRYSVKGVSIWSGAGLLDHKELLIVAQD